MGEGTALEAVLRRAALRLPASRSARLDARVIVKHALGLDDAGLIIEGRRVLTRDETERIDALIARRASGEPVAYIVSEKEFFGLTFKTARGVLVPRPDSETVIEAAASRLDRDRPLRILDLGTGTGCLLCALLTVFPKAQGVGLDIDEEAATLAAVNAKTLGLGDRARILHADWAAAEGQFDLIVSNPPYIATRDRHTLDADVRDFENPQALFAGEEGLDAYASLFAILPQLAATNSFIVLELGDGQAASVAAMASVAFPGALMETARDLAGRERALLIHALTAQAGGRSAQAKKGPRKAQKRD